LIGGGSGAASLTLLAKWAQGEGQQVIVGLGARSGEQLMLTWCFEELGHQVLIATDDGSRGHPGTVLDAIDDLLVRGWPDGVYACGPEPMLVGVARRTKSLGLPCWVSLERVMRCGIGVCGSCHCGDQLVCKDGPVFSAETFLSCSGGRS
jgi:dihydroorotate dehydrogenase electron transfer subunit